MNDAFAETDVPRADTARSYAAAAAFLAVSVLGLEAAVAGFAEAPATDLWAHDSLPRVVTAVVFGLALHAWSRRRAERDEPPISVRARRVLLAGYLTAAALVVLATSGAMPVLDRVQRKRDERQARLPMSVVVGASTRDRLAWREVGGGH